MSFIDVLKALFTREKTIGERLRDGILKGDFSKRTFSAGKTASTILAGGAAAASAGQSVAHAQACVQNEAARDKE